MITKTRVSSFYASPLEAILSAQGITHLVLPESRPNGVVEGTARDAVDRDTTSSFQMTAARPFRGIAPRCPGRRARDAYYSL